jgi:hypothetical protein
VRSQPLPLWLVRHVLNPVVRRAVPAGVGGPVVLLRFTGRRTGIPREVPAIGHVVDGVLTVFTDRPWALNFRGGHRVVVLTRGRRLVGEGRLLDGSASAAALRVALGQVSRPAVLGLRVAPGVVPGVDDLAGLRRAVRLTVRP